MSQSIDHDVTAVLEAIDHYSDGDVDHPQEIMVELSFCFANAAIRGHGPDRFFTECRHFLSHVREG